MVGAFSSATFARDELLARCLVGCVAPTFCFDSPFVFSLSSEVADGYIRMRVYYRSTISLTSG